MTHWWTRLLARHLHLGDATVTRAWREYKIQPWRMETFKFSTDPELVAKVTTSSGFTWNPRRTQSCSAWTRRARSRRWTGPRPCCRCSPACPSGAPDYERHGTTTLFAALEIATGKVTGACGPRHRPQAFLKQAARAYPTGELHLVMDNYATHKKAEVGA